MGEAIIGEGGRLVGTVAGDTIPWEVVIAAGAVAGDTAVVPIPKSGMLCGDSTRGGAVASAFVRGITGSGDDGGTETVDDAVQVALAFCLAIICSAANAYNYQKKVSIHCKKRNYPLHKTHTSY